MTVYERHNRTTILDSHRYTTNSIVEAKKQPKLRSAFYKLAGPSLDVEYICKLDFTFTYLMFEKFKLYLPLKVLSLN